MSLARRKGFSLIEILIALGILAVGITAVLGLMTAATATHKRAVNRVSAAWLAEGIFDDLESELTPDFDLQRYPSSGPTSTIVLDGTVDEYPGYIYSLHLTPLDNRGDPPILFLAEIEVHWRMRGAANSEWFRTVLRKRLDVGTGRQPSGP